MCEKDKRHRKALERVDCWHRARAHNVKLYQSRCKYVLCNDIRKIEKCPWVRVRPVVSRQIYLEKSFFLAKFFGRFKGSCQCELRFEYLNIIYMWNTHKWQSNWQMYEGVVRSWLVLLGTETQHRRRSMRSVFEDWIDQHHDRRPSSSVDSREFYHWSLRREREKKQ